jgi:hypothetical protein
MGREGGSKYYQTERASLIILALFKAGFKIGWEDDKI